MIEDSAIIEKCLKGETDAFGLLVERYQSAAVGHALAILGNREDARDAAQEAFVDAFRALGRFDRTRRFYPWFYVLLRNRCYKFVAKRPATEELGENEFLAVREGLAEIERIALEKALCAITKEEREIIALKYLDGFSYDEIAALLEIPRGTVMSRLFHARRELQAKLTGKFH